MYQPRLQFTKIVYYLLCILPLLAIYKCNGETAGGSHPAHIHLNFAPDGKYFP
jgi:hypothetical protein